MQSIEIKFLVLLVNLAQPVLVPHYHLIIELRMIHGVILSLLSPRVATHLVHLLTAFKEHPQLLCLIADNLGILLVAPGNHAFHLSQLALHVISFGLLSEGVGHQVVRESLQLS